MSMGDSDGGALMASNVNKSLMGQYGVAGTPAVAGALNYAEGSIDRPLGDYVNNAYDQARSGVRQTLMRQVAGAGGRANAQLGSGSGAGLGSLTSIAASGGQAYANQRQSVDTTQAVAGLEQRNKLLGVMAGGGASATNLGAGFGQVANQGIGLAQQPSQALGLGLGGIAAGLGIYGQSQVKSSLGSWSSQGMPNTGAWSPNMGMGFSSSEQANGSYT